MQISILGCGWLGFPLAKALIANGFTIKGSTTSESKLLDLKNSGIQPFFVSLSAVEGLFQGEISLFLENSKILIINIPPKLRGENSESFVAKIEKLIPFIEKSSIEKVLFVSSTSVYGNENEVVTEETIPFPETESGMQLGQVEQLLQSNTNFKTTIIRFGGLIGDDRHPVYFLAGRQNLENPDAPINLIHQTDCIGIILKIIKTNCWNETFNAVAPFHPSRKGYYTQKSMDLKLEIPHFSDEKSVGKIINSEKTERILGYTFIENKF